MGKVKNLLYELDIESACFLELRRMLRNLDLFSQDEVVQYVYDLMQLQYEFGLSDANQRQNS
jgi:hypothetical protein